MGAEAFGVGHGGGRTEAQGEGGYDRLRRLQAGERPGANLATLRLEVPERAVDRIARCAGREATRQSRTVESRLDRVAHGFDLGEYAGHALAIAGVGRALAAAAQRTVGDLDHDDQRLGLGAPRDHEGRRERPRLDGRANNPQSTSPTAASSRR